MAKNREQYHQKWKIWSIVLLMLVWGGVGTPKAYAQATKRYLILLKDKAGTPYKTDQAQGFLSQRSLFRRAKQGIPVTSRDLPVTPSYVSAIAQTGAKVWYTSRWLNAVLIEANASVLARVQQLAFVKGVESSRSLDSEPSTEAVQSGAKAVQEDLPTLPYGNSLTQIQQLGVDKMHAKGYRGEGMMIAVFDNGFLNVNRTAHFRHLFSANKITATYDFVNRNTDVYDAGSHGANVLSTLAGRSDSALIGTAFNASFVLLHTEDDARETRIEEANWLVAAEYADSIGVDIISSSLGYYNFDDPTTDYQYADLTGNKALITRAADWAAGVGMVVLTAAGNEGNTAWRYVSVPADADSVLAVGAVNRLLNYVSFSSIGPTANGRIKPDVSAMGQGTVLYNPGGFLTSGNGTSYATPLLAGLVAGLWQAYPYLSAMQVIDIIKKSGHQAAAPNNQIGYGVPHFGRAEALVPKPLQVPAAPRSGFVVYPNPFVEGVDPIIQFDTPQGGASLRASLFDMSGRAIWSNELPHETHSLPFGSLHLSAGLYLLTLQRDGVVYTKPILKQ
jgi:subtilisin family serine protease